MNIDQETKDRFMFYVVKTESCWLWKAVPPIKYGHFTFNGTTYTASRFSYMIHKGEIPVGLVIRHTCDIPSCVNPDHLLTGTHKENLEDMYARGRNGRPRKDRSEYGSYCETIDGKLYASINVKIAHGKYKRLRRRIEHPDDAPAVVAKIKKQYQKRSESTAF